LVLGVAVVEIRLLGFEYSIQPTIDTKKYKIIGVPFYINEQENEFREKLLKSIK
jgi:hypothetical protein